MPVITAKCPHCGSDEVREICRVTNAQKVIEWMTTEHGLVPADYGNIETYYDTAERIYFDCEDCGDEFAQPDFYADGVKVEPKTEST